jgi:hypothetical protein
MIYGKVRAGALMKSVYLAGPYKTAKKAEDLAKAVVSALAKDYGPFEGDKAVGSISARPSADTLWVQIVWNDGRTYSDKQQKDIEALVEKAAK